MSVISVRMNDSWLPSVTPPLEICEESRSASSCLRFSALLQFSAPDTGSEEAAILAPLSKSSSDSVMSYACV